MLVQPPRKPIRCISRSWPWGGVITTELGVTSYSTDPVLLTISAHKPDGTLYLDEITGENPVVRALAAGATLREDAGQMFGFKPGPLLDGWVKVRSTSTRSLNGYVSYSIPQTGSLAAVSFGFPQTRAVFSHLATTLGFFTGVAMLNPGALLADVKVLVLDPQGNVLGSFSSVLRPGERISKLITELVSASRWTAPRSDLGEEQSADLPDFALRHP